MKSIFLIGDFKTDSGPGVANKMLERGFKNYSDILISRQTNKVCRIIEMIYGVARSKNICLCSSSWSNLFVLKLCRIFSRKVYYLMHGYLVLESKIAGESEEITKKLQEYEKTIFSSVDKIICVSEGCCSYMISARPEFADKFDFINNAVDVSEIEQEISDRQGKEFDKTTGQIAKKYTICSLGGGVCRKNNKAVCEAIQELCAEGNDIRYIVIGKKETYGEEIQGYDFVEYHESLPREQVIEKMRESDLYIQNSIFETFGLAPVEALFSGCSLLVSENVGMRTLIQGYDEFVINNDAEIKEKIAQVMNSPNNMKLRQCFDIDAINPENVATNLYNEIVTQ